MYVTSYPRDKLTQHARKKPVDSPGRSPSPQSNRLSLNNKMYYTFSGFTQRLTGATSSSAYSPHVCCRFVFLREHLVTFICPYSVLRLISISIIMLSDAENSVNLPSSILTKNMIFNSWINLFTVTPMFWWHSVHFNRYSIPFLTPYVLRLNYRNLHFSFIYNKTKYGYLTFIKPWLMFMVKQPTHIFEFDKNICI